MIGTRWRRASNAPLSNLTVDATSPVPSLLVPSPRTPTATSPRTPTSASSTMPRTPTSYQSNQPRPSMSRTESSRSSGSGEGSVYRGAAYAASTPRLSTSAGRSTWELVDASSQVPDRNMQSIRTTRNFIFPLSEEFGPVSSVSEVEGRSGKLGHTGFIGAYEDEPVVVVELRIDSRKTVPIARTTISKTPREMVSTLDMVRYHALLPEGTTVRQTARRLEPERPERRSMIRKSSVPQLSAERTPIPPPVAFEREETSPALSSAPTLGSSIASPITPSVVFVPSPPSPALSQFPADDIAFPLPPTSIPTPQMHSQPKFRRTMSSCSTTLSSCSTTSSADMPTYEDQVPMYPRPPPRRERRAPPSACGSSISHGSSVSHGSMMSMGSSIAPSSFGHSDELESEDSKRLSQSSAEPTTPTTPTTPTSNSWTHTRLQRSPSHQRAPIFKRSMSFRPPSSAASSTSPIASPGATFTALPPSEMPTLGVVGEAPAITPKSERRVSLARKRESALLGPNALYEANPSLTDIIAEPHAL